MRKTCHVVCAALGEGKHCGSGGWRGDGRLHRGGGKSYDPDMKTAITIALGNWARQGGAALRGGKCEAEDILLWRI